MESAREGGKPLRDSQVEVARVLECLELACEHIAQHTGARVPMGASERTAERLAVTQKEPIGVVVAVSAFNHPLNLIAHQVFSAVAAGAPVIVKPAEDTPLACLRLVHILHEAGLPPAWCQCLMTRTNSVANRLVTDARVAFLSFIGSAAVGWKLRSQLPPGTRCALEHGGLAPVVMAVDANQAAACSALTAGGFYHAGQVCVSVQRVFAPRAWAREFGQQLAHSAQALQVGDPTLDTTEVGPLIRPAEVERVHDWVQEAIQGGAELLCGGELLITPAIAVASRAAMRPPCCTTHPVTRECRNRKSLVRWWRSIPTTSWKTPVIRPMGWRLRFRLRCSRIHWTRRCGCLSG